MYFLFYLNNRVLHLNTILVFLFWIYLLLTSYFNKLYSMIFLFRYVINLVTAIIIAPYFLLIILCLYQCFSLYQIFFIFQDLYYYKNFLWIILFSFYFIPLHVFYEVLIQIIPTAIIAYPHLVFIKIIFILFIHLFFCQLVFFLLKV